MDYDERNIFARILRGELSCAKVFEDDVCLAFRDIQPQAPQHIVLIPKAPLARLSSATAEHATVLGELMLRVGQIARREGLVDGGFRIVVNDGAGAQQSVFHLHLHILAGRDFTWPPG